MVREQVQANPGQFLHQHMHNQQHTHEFGRAQVPVPVGYVKETHLHAHTVLVPEETITFWSPFATFFSRYWLPLLLGALLLGTTLYFLRKFARRAREIPQKVRGMKERVKERAGAMKEKVKERIPNVKQRFEQDVVRREERQTTLKENIETQHKIAESNREEQIRKRIRSAESDIGRVEAMKHRSGPESAVIEDEIHTYGSREMVQNRLPEAERLIGQTELEKHQRGVETAILEDQLHTIGGVQEIQETTIVPEVEATYVESRTRAAKTPKRTVKSTTVVETYDDVKGKKKIRDETIMHEGGSLDQTTVQRKRAVETD